MPERIMPNLPADVRPSDAHLTTKKAHSIQPATPSPPRPIRLSATEAIRRIPTRYRGAPPSQHQRQQDHLAPSEFARAQSAFGSHPVPPASPDRCGANPVPYALYNAQPMPSPYSSPPPPPHHGAYTPHH
ncbi:hypothetical protein M422DRAFT_257411 [Sphaerobolus stellatus SS14]|uniref:Uncharacterized protein n=1 Tax=Sphaerobolus stellatus (strain SS14) TaxID=990650 RepID=A0A0C9UPH4_SPHS4|nr:hypothetical protein M422DRAFT_267551 [Sphaerobolus stellatus SS14]KIJ39812.1 hypothetical protein M422DRAFT_257411 [Sphaerobolus stellatus SS14]